MKNLADEILRTAVIVLVSALMLRWAYGAVHPFLWLIGVLAVVVAFLKYQRR